MRLAVYCHIDSSIHGLDIPYIVALLLADKIKNMNLTDTIVSSFQEYIGDKPKGSSKRLAGFICIIAVLAMVTASLIPELKYSVDKPVLDSLLMAAGIFFGIDATKQAFNKYSDNKTPNAPKN